MLRGVEMASNKPLHPAADCHQKSSHLPHAASLLPPVAAALMYAKQEL